MRAASHWFGTINATLDVMRQQDSKIVAKAKMKEMAVKRAASLADSVRGSRASSVTASLPVSAASSTVLSFPASGPPLASSSVSDAPTRKRTAPEITLGPILKRAKQAPSPPASPAQPKTPDQPLQPADPDLSHGSTSTNISGNTVELKDEETTKVLMNRFLTDSLAILSIEFRRITWHTGQHRLELMHTYIASRLRLFQKPRFHQIQTGHGNDHRNQ